MDCCCVGLCKLPLGPVVSGLLYSIASEESLKTDSSRACESEIETDIAQCQRLRFKGYV